MGDCLKRGGRQREELTPKRAGRPKRGQKASKRGAEVKE